LAQLQTKEQQLKKELEKKKKDAEKLQAAIQNIIKKEMEAARLAANKPKDPQKPDIKWLGLTPEAMELSNNFAGNKGKLPWPVLKGMVTEGFGPHEHPTLKGVIVDNHGIDISTTKGALVRALFEGEVKSVGLIPGSGRYVLIRHGEFLTVYNNLSEIYVNTGDKVTTKQNIGIVAYDEEENKTVLQLQVWKGSNKLDPQEWLSKSSK
jgi:murein hydrolase activator